MADEYVATNSNSLDDVEEYLSNVEESQPSFYSNQYDWGTTQDISISAGGSSAIAVTFFRKFTDVPAIVATVNTPKNVRYFCSINNVTKEGFKAYIKDEGNTATTCKVCWIAIGE